jgi:hypothetical protein
MIRLINPNFQSYAGPPLFPTRRWIFVSFHELKLRNPLQSLIFCIWRRNKADNKGPRWTVYILNQIVNREYAGLILGQHRTRRMKIVLSPPYLITSRKSVLAGFLRADRGESLPSCTEKIHHEPKRITREVIPHKYWDSVVYILHRSTRNLDLNFELNLTDKPQQDTFRGSETNPCNDRQLI